MYNHCKFYNYSAGKLFPIFGVNSTDEALDALDAGSRVVEDEGLRLSARPPLMHVETGIVDTYESWCDEHLNQEELEDCIECGMYVEVEWRHDVETWAEPDDMAPHT